jgi:putative transposase
MFTQRPEHLKAFDYLGCYRYFLTFCTHNRRHIFTKPEAVALVLTQIERGADQERFAIVAYCFMPDHAHLLVEGRQDDSDCRRFIARAKQFSGFYFRKEFAQPLWQRYGFERTLRDKDATLSVARYILENPLRAGLVDQVADYPYVGSRAYSLGEILDAAYWPAKAGHYACGSG